jgi:hypothetical protein
MSRLQVRLHLGSDAPSCLIGVTLIVKVPLRLSLEIVPRPVFGGFLEGKVVGFELFGKLLVGRTVGLFLSLDGDLVSFPVFYKVLFGLADVVLVAVGSNCKVGLPQA